MRDFREEWIYLFFSIFCRNIMRYFEEQTCLATSRNIVKRIILACLILLEEYMALVRLLVVSTVIDNKTKESVGTSVGFINSPFSKPSKRVFKNMPCEGYTMKVITLDTHVQKHFDKFVEEGATVVVFK